MKNYRDESKKSDEKSTPVQNIGSASQQPGKGSEDKKTDNKPMSPMPPQKPKPVLLSESW